MMTKPILVLAWGLNRRWYYSHSTDIEESVNTDACRAAGIDMYFAGPAHHNTVSYSKSLEEMYERMGGKPDIIFISGIWRMHYLRRDAKSPERKKFLDYCKQTHEDMERYETIEQEFKKDKDIKIVRIDHDFWHSGSPREIKPKEGKAYRIVSPYATPAYKPLVQKFFVNAHLYPLPFSVKDSFTNNTTFPPKEYDLMIPGAGGIKMDAKYPFRVSTRIATQDIGYKTLPQGTRLTQLDYFMAMRKTKILVYCGGYWGIMFKKIVEMLASGSFIIAPTGIKGFKEVGLIDGVHLVESSIEGINDTIQYYLDHEKEREEIAANGHEFFLNNMTSTHITNKYFVPLVKEIYNEQYARIPGE